MFKVNFKAILIRIGKALFPVILTWAIEYFLASIDTPEERKKVAEDLLPKLDFDLPIPIPDSLKLGILEKILEVLYEEFKK